MKVSRSRAASSFPFLRFVRAGDGRCAVFVDGRFAITTPLKRRYAKLVRHRGKLTDTPTRGETRE